MSQATLDDDELFSEAASEVREDVETSLETARASLPAATDVWDVEADNTLGVLNGLRSDVDTEAAREALRDAKKWYTMGEKADAFDDADDLATEIEDLEGVLEDLATVKEHVGELASAIPELKSTLEELETDADPDVDADASTAEA